ncbi:MAG: glycosyltransferase family 9 protein [Elusimicrobia bacterium]|nr:glycosyltransferase family 9 protein [Elusimicrobiota bacterium]
MANALELASAPFAGAPDGAGSLGPLRSVLVLRMDGIGDAVLTLPLLAALKAAHPQAAIDCLARPGAAEILRGHPAVRRVLAAPSRRADLMRGLALRAMHYDLIVNPRNDGYLWGHLLSILAGGRRRVGYAHKGGGALLTDVVPWAGEKPLNGLMRDVARRLGAEAASRPDLSHLGDFHGRRGNKTSRRLVVGLNPLASHRHVWSEERFAAVGDRLARDFGADVVFLGDAAAVPAVERIRRGMAAESASTAGQTSLREAIDVIAGLDLLVTVDSGPRHIANALDVPAVVLRNGANSSVVWGRYADKETVLVRPVPCSPCGRGVCPVPGRPCMLDIGVDDVVDAAGRVLAANLASGGRR